MRVEEAASRTAKKLRVRMLSPAGLERINRAVLSGRILPFLAAATALVTLAAAVVVRVFAHGEFDTFGESLWWAAQTVTTVGYGDVIPQTTFSKVIAVVVMFFGIAAVSLVTAVVTSAVMASSQRSFLTEQTRNEEHLSALERIEERLESIERRLPD